MRRGPRRADEGSPATGGEAVCALSSIKVNINALKVPLINKGAILKVNH
jgi:hypothetical protein